MDMKRILQAIDGVATKPVAGANDMAKFLSIVDKNASIQLLQEAKSPHKVTLPVQMAMQHYQKEETIQKPVGRDSVIKKYFHEAEQELQEYQVERKQLMNQYASIIAERVLMKESVTTNENEIPGHSMGFTGGVGPGMGDYEVDEMSVILDKDNPIKSKINHKSNPGSIEYRIMRARGQLKDLAQQAESNELIVWESIARHFPELAMNIEEIRHGIEELAKIRKGGGRRVHNIPKEIGENAINTVKQANAQKRAIKPKKTTTACKSNQRQVGVQNKNGQVVPKCAVVKGPIGK